MASQRALTLTEELEKLDQSITLTLQEIDANFSRAHRIVTTSILPVVEKYRENSNDVWEGSKFWKQFFEASANVSLSGYEETAPDGGEEDETTVSASPSASAQTTPSTSTYASPPHAQDDDDVTMTPTQDQTCTDAGDLSPSPAQATPRAQAKTRKKASQPPTTAPYSSPYESLKRETLGAESSPSPSEPTLPSTPRAGAVPSPRKASRTIPRADFASSPFIPPSTARSRNQNAQRIPANDVLLHRVLDKNWRIQATPHSTARTTRLPTHDRRLGSSNTGEAQQTPRPGTARRRQQVAATQSRSTAFQDEDDLDSSPPAPAPELHAEIFGTPAARKSRAPVPGVSVLTPAAGKNKGGMSALRDNPSARTAAAAATATNGKTNSQQPSFREDLWDSDDDDDDGGFPAGMSPPKTMQFHVPQSRLIRTPAREASKRIVQDLLYSAGMKDGLEDSTDQDLEEEDSPSIVKKGGLLEEDTF